MFHAKLRLSAFQKCLTLCLYCLLSLSLQAGEGDATPLTGNAKFPDVVLLDQDGNKVHFYKDLVQDKVVAINFIFTSCPTICPPMGVNFGKLQQLLGDHAARNINLISISVDPTTDTPQRLKAWAAKFGAQPGWTLLTGAKHDVDTLLKAMNSFSADITSHSPTVLIGNEATGNWTRADGLGAPAHLASAIQSVLKTTGGKPQ